MKTTIAGTGFIIASSIYALAFSTHMHVSFGNATVFAIIGGLHFVLGLCLFTISAFISDNKKH